MVKTYKTTNHDIKRIIHDSRIRQSFSLFERTRTRPLGQPPIFPGGLRHSPKHGTNKKYQGETRVAWNEGSTDDEEKWIGVFHLDGDP